MAFETDPWAYKEAAYHGVRRDGPPRHIVLHSTQSTGTARAIWDWFARPNVGDERKGSAHVTAGRDGIFQSVLDSYVPHAAPGANHDGMHIELVGRAEWSRREWLAQEETLTNGASAAAQYALKFALPLTNIGRSGLAKNWKGTCTHDDVSKVFKRSSHWDPGPNFPMDVFLDLAKAEFDRRSGKKPPVVILDPLPPFDYEVGCIWRGAPDEGVARTVGRAPSYGFRVLHADADAFVGVRLNFGFEEKVRESGLIVHTFQGAGREETADFGWKLILAPERGTEFRKQGRELAAKRAKGIWP